MPFVQVATHLVLPKSKFNIIPGQQWLKRLDFSRYFGRTSRYSSRIPWSWQGRLVLQTLYQPISLSPLNLKNVCWRKLCSKILGYPDWSFVLFASLLNMSTILTLYSEMPCGYFRQNLLSWWERRRNSPRKYPLGRWKNAHLFRDGSTVLEPQQVHWLFFTESRQYYLCCVLETLCSLGKVHLIWQGGGDEDFETRSLKF